MTKNEQESLTNESSDSSPSTTNSNAYWHANLRIIGALLVVWFAVSFGCGILFVEQLNQFSLFGFKLGFWWAQQGSIFVFVILIFVYVVLMQRLDRRFKVSDDDEVIR